MVCSRSGFAVPGVQFLAPFGDGGQDDDAGGVIGWPSSNFVDIAQATWQRPVARSRRHTSMQGEGTIR